MGFKLLHHALDVFLLGIAIALSKASPTQVDHDGHVEFFHFSGELINLGFVDASLVAVDIDKGKFCSRYWMLRHLECGRRIVGLKTHFLGDKSTSAHQQGEKKKANCFHKF